MIKNVYPIINVGEIIDKETLELLRDNPMEIINLMGKRYKNGIIDGFGITVDSENNKIITGSGILKFENKLFWSINPYEIEIPEIEETYIIKLKLNSITEERKKYIRTGSFILEKGKEIKNDELEIARFIKREGAELRTAYNKYEDLNREYNTINLIYRKYSCLDSKGRLDPLILKIWGKEAFEKENLDSFDINFASRALDYEVSRDNTIMYINRKFEEKKENYTNEEIYLNLLKILDNLGRGRKLREEKRIRPHKIIVD